MNTTWTIITVIMAIGTTLMVTFMVGYVRFLIKKIKRLKKELNIYKDENRPSMRPIF